MTTDELPTIERMAAERDIDGLIGALRSPDEATRQAAVAALVAAKDPHIIDLMTPLAEDPDQNVRSAALEVMLCTYTGRQGGQPTRQRAAQPAQGQELTRAQKLGVHAGMFLAGAVMWGVAIGFLILMTSLKLGGLTWLGVIIGLVPLLFLIARSVEGWDLVYVNKQGEPDGFYKVGVYLFFLFAGVGILLSCYWSGRALLRAYVDRGVIGPALPVWFLRWLVRGNRL